MSIDKIPFTRLLVFAGCVAVSPSTLAIGSGGLAQPTLDAIERRVEQSAERAVQRAAEERTVERVVHQTVEKATTRVEKLAGRLPIRRRDGREAFIDARVENNWRAVERQWLVTITPDEAEMFDQPGITPLEQTELSGLGITILRFRVSEALDSLDALKSLFPEDIVDRLDRNHIYNPETGSAIKSPENPKASRLHCDAPLNIGMVDTAIQTDHPSFANANIVQKRFLAEEQLIEPDDHGTAVASLLVGTLPQHPEPRLGNATLLNASVFFGRNNESSGATLMHLVEGLDWLVSQKADVINVSMAGPDNTLLRLAIRRIIENGIPVVAAVGNQGPSAPPLFPAAYPDVVGITAISRARRPYRWANRGEQVDFAAIGVDVMVASSNGHYERQSGTSLATPLASARLACDRVSTGAAIADLFEGLTMLAIDLGEPGKDPIFGYGLLDRL